MKLLDQVRERLRVKHYSYRTEKAYVHWIERYIRFHGIKHPNTMGTVEVEQFLTHLAVEGRVSASTQNQALGALLFLYQQVLEMEIGRLDAVRAGTARPQRCADDDDLHARHGESGEPSEQSAGRAGQRMNDRGRFAEAFRPNASAKRR